MNKEKKTINWKYVFDNYVCIIKFMHTLKHNTGDEKFENTSIAQIKVYS